MAQLESQTTQQHIHGERSSHIQECIDHCLECFESCSNLIPHCLKMGDDHASPDHIGLLSLCAETCQLSVKAMQFDSDFQEQICDLCADLCERCAEDCEEIGSDDEEMLACAKVCRQCAESCRNMMQ